MSWTTNRLSAGRKTLKRHASKIHEMITNRGFSNWKSRLCQRGFRSFATDHERTGRTQVQSFRDGTEDFGGISTQYSVLSTRDEGRGTRDRYRVPGSEPIKDPHGDSRFAVFQLEIEVLSVRKFKTLNHGTHGIHGRRTENGCHGLGILDVAMSLPFGPHRRREPRNNRKKRDHESNELTQIKKPHDDAEFGAFKLENEVLSAAFSRCGDILPRLRVWPRF